MWWWVASVLVALSSKLTLPLLCIFSDGVVSSNLGEPSFFLQKLGSQNPTPKGEDQPCSALALPQQRAKTLLWGKHFGEVLALWRSASADRILSRTWTIAS